MNTTTITTTFQYFQSANSSFEEIKQYFVVRIKEYEFIRSNLFDDQMAGSVQHFLILGRRGSGKSTLLKRLECEINENETLKEKYISINFAEEQASIHRLFDLFEEIIKTLRYSYGFTNLPDTDTLDIPDDYSEYSRELYYHIQSALQSHSKKLLLLIDNIDKIFLGIKEDAQVLREILLNYDDIKIIGGSTRMSEHFWQYDLPFYQFFSILRLEALRSEEIKSLLISWSQRLQIKELEDFVKTKPGRLEAIRILTDGMPRTLQFFVDLLINRPQQNGYAYIQKIMDMVTPLYQERLNNLLPIEQKIVLKLAFIWEAASIRDLVKPTKIESKLLSANLKKLSDNKIVDTIATGKKNHLYRLSERFFNMWLIVTQGNPMEKRKARWLTIFIENFYDQKEIKQMVKKHLEDLKSCSLKEDHLTLMTKALSESKYTSFEERDLLIEQNLSIPTLDESLKSTLPSKSSAFTEKIQKLIDEKKYDEAVEEVKGIPNEADGMKALFLGKISYLSGSIDDAEKYLKKALDKGNYNAYVDIAIFYTKEGKFELAEKYHLKALEEKIERSAYYLALFYVMDKKYELAEKIYSEAIEKEEEQDYSFLALIYDLQNKLEYAEKYYLKAIENRDNEALNSLAILYDNQGKYEIAEKYYLNAIEKGVDDALRNIALLYKNQENNDLAEKYFLKAIEKEDINALFNIAHLYKKQENYDLAEKFYLKAYDFGIKEAMDNLAYLFYIDMKNREKLKAVLKKWSYNSINKRQYQILSQIWNGDMNGVQDEVIRLAKEKDGIDEMFLTHLLVHHQKNLGWKIFNDAEIGIRFRNKFAPLYYVTSQLIDNEESKMNLLKIPPEIEEMVQDILNKIEKLRKEYYPED